MKFKINDREWEIRETDINGLREQYNKDLVEEDTNERRTRIFFDRFRNRSVEKAIETLIQQLPEDLPENEDEGFGEDLLKDPNAPDKDDDDFSNISIEDI